MFKLTKIEKKILLLIYKSKHVYDSNPSSVGEIYSIYKTQYDKDQIKDFLRNIAKYGYIKIKDEKFEKDDSFGIPNAYSFDLIKKEIRFMIYEDLIKQTILQTWSWLWRHIIITILVSIITTYITIKFIR